MSEDGSAQMDTATSPHRRWFRIALVATVLMVVMVLASFPLAIQSMREVLGRSQDSLYDLVTGVQITPDNVAEAEAERTYFNVGIVKLDDITGEATLAISGNRHCGDACPTLEIIFLALDDDAAQRRGLPPSVTLSLLPEDHVFSESVQLPVRGQPSLYPFDTYRLWLGVSGVAVEPDGRRIEIDSRTLRESAVVTIQNRIPDMLMDPPATIDPESVRASTDPYLFMSVQALTFKRPAYLKVLAVSLVLLIGVSALLALAMRGLDELILGIGGIILGVWGVRSVLMPQSIGTVTAVDLALSWLILLLLLGLAIRAAIYFQTQSGIPAPWRRGKT